MSSYNLKRSQFLINMLYFLCNGLMRYNKTLYDYDIHAIPQQTAITYCITTF